MSLVDAIRQAAASHASNATAAQVQQAQQTSAAAPEATLPQANTEAGGEVIELTQAIDETQRASAVRSAATGAMISPTPTHGVVRLELMLSPEQLHELLRGLLNGVHGVFTLREAAHYLRMTSGALTSMAESGLLPGFLVEGKWRFSKQALDEWMARKGQENTASDMTEGTTNAV